jgi:Ca2+-binding EF-hand superfamily protein
MRAIKILTAAVFAALAVSAYADPGGPGGPACQSGAASPGCAAGAPGARGPGGAHMLERLKAADTNADGMISRDEAKAGLPRIFANFDAIDANKDGFITFDELKAYHQQHRAARAAEHWKLMDANGDGKISREEAARFPRLAQHFDEIDANKDGFITQDEMRDARAQHSGRNRPQ